MFDFKKEVNRFKPMTEIDNLESAMLGSEVQDIMDLLRLYTQEKPAKDNASKDQASKKKEAKKSKE